MEAQVTDSYVELTNDQLRGVKGDENEGAPGADASEGDSLTQPATSRHHQTTRPSGCTDTTARHWTALPRRAV
jgi:hypothetical protein